MRKTLNGILLGTVLICPAFLLCAGQDQMPPSPDQKENQADIAPKGIKPRTSAAQYAAHAELKIAVIGATRLTPDDIRDAFATDLNRCCVVLEVAVYPEKERTAELARDDFTLRVAGTEVIVKPSSPKLLALTLQLTAPAGRDAGLHGSVGVTYGPGGYDPTTGQHRGSQTGTSADVSNDTGLSGPDKQVTETDREFMELELSRKGLPEGEISAPVAGYLYFPLPKKKKKKAAFQLEYALGDQKIVLNLP